MRQRGRYEVVGVRRAIAFSRRHVWPMSAVGMAAIVSSACGLVLSFEAMMRGPFIVGYLGVVVAEEDGADLLNA